MRAHWRQSPHSHLAKPTPLTLYGVAHHPDQALLNMARQEEEMKVREEGLRSATAKAQELLGKVVELEEKTATLSRENDLTDQLQAARGALGKAARAGGLGTSQTQKGKEGHLPRRLVHPGHGEFLVLPFLHCHVTLTQLPKISITFLFAHSSRLGTHTYSTCGVWGIIQTLGGGGGHRMVGGAPLASLRTLGPCPLFSDSFSSPIKYKHNRENK